MEEIVIKPEDFDSIFENLNDCLTKFEKNSSWLNFIKTANFIGPIYYYNFKNILEFENIIFQSYEIIENYNIEDKEAIAETLHNLSYIYSEKKQFSKAIELNKQAIAIDKQAKPTDLAATYNNMADVYKIIGDYENAKLYFQKAIDLTNDSLYYNIPGYKLGLARIFKLQHQYNKAILHYEACNQSINLITKGIDTIQYLNQVKFMCHIDLSEIYLLENDMKKCIDQSNQAFAILSIDSTLSENYKKAELSARINIYKNNYQTAIEQLQIAEKTYLREYEGFNKGKDLANIINQMGDIYLKLNEPIKAITAYHKALKTVCNNFNSNDIYTNPLVNDFFNKRSAIETLSYKAKALQQVNLKATYKTYQLIANLIPITRRDYLEENSKFQLADETNGIYENAIKTCIQLYEKTKDKQYYKAAFKFAESSKAILLQQNMQANVALAGLNDALQKEDYDLKTSIDFHEQQIGTFSDTSQESKSNISNWRAELLDLKENYRSFKSKIEKENPNYYALKYATSLASIEDIQNKLDKQTALIEYFVGSSEIYIFKIEQNDFEVFVSPKGNDFDEEVIGLKEKLIKRPKGNSFKDEFKSFCNQSNSLYKKILEKPIQQLSPAINSLLIIPDGSLHQISFDILLKDLNNVNSDSDYCPKNVSYLAEDFALCYSSSASLLIRSLKPFAKNYSNNFLGFAPTFNDLNNNVQEVEQINSILGGQIFTDTAANFETFKNNAAQAQIIHLSTHAKKNEQNHKLSEIHFSDSIINNFQIENMNLNADLTVLSACETGTGKIQKGEGTMSLSRSFFLAGCPSLLSGLWRADDESTAEIMVNFYKNLIAGDTKDRALQKAKLNYCTDSKLFNKHPFFWANFMLSGNRSALF